jgi:hypothetical protein
VFRQALRFRCRRGFAGSPALRMQECSALFPCRYAALDPCRIPAVRVHDPEVAIRQHAARCVADGAGYDGIDAL